MGHSFIHTEAFTSTQEVLPFCSFLSHISHPNIPGMRVKDCSHFTGHFWQNLMPYLCSLFLSLVGVTLLNNDVYNFIPHVLLQYGSTFGDYELSLGVKMVKPLSC